MWTAEDRDGWRFMGDASTSSGRQKAEDNLNQVTFTNLQLATQGIRALFSLECPVHYQNRG